MTRVSELSTFKFANSNNILVKEKVVVFVLLPRDIEMNSDRRKKKQLNYVIGIILLPVPVAVRAKTMNLDIHFRIQ